MHEAMADNTDTNTKLISYMHDDASGNKKHNRYSCMHTAYYTFTQYNIECSTDFTCNATIFLDYTQLDSSSHLGLHF